VKWFRNIGLVTLLGLLSILFSCGLDVFIYLHPVSYRDFDPTSDPVFNYFSFRTSDARNYSEAADYFKGFEIYYRIYNNSGKAATDRLQINQYNEDNPYLAYNYIINTKKYRRMRTTERTSTPLIAASNTNRQVTVRLLPYVDEVPSMYVASTYYGVPRRSADEGIHSDTSKFEFDEIRDGDPDVTWTTWNDVNNKQFYVQAYVMAYGYDESYKQLYSELYYLGFITLEE